MGSERFPAISEAVHYFKETEGGKVTVCKIVEDYAKEYAKEHAHEYAKDIVEEYAKEYAKDTVIQLISNYLSSGATEEDAIKNLKVSKEDVEKAKQLLTVAN